MPCMREWITQFFNTVISKVNDKADSMEVSSPTDNQTSISPSTLDNETESQLNEEVKEEV